jgi:hypothetical protein
MRLGAYRFPTSGMLLRSATIRALASTFSHTARGPRIGHDRCGTGASLGGRKIWQTPDHPPGADHAGSIRWVADLNTRTRPEHPLMLFDQMTTADPSRSPAGTENAWAYTHLPRGWPMTSPPNGSPPRSTASSRSTLPASPAISSARRRNAPHFSRRAMRTCTPVPSTRKSHNHSSS